MNAFVGGVSDFFVPTNLLAVAAVALMTGRARHPFITLAMFAFGIAGGGILIALAAREGPSGSVLLALAAASGILVLTGRVVLAFFVSALASAVGVMLAVNTPPQEITIAAEMAYQAGVAVAALATFAVIMMIARRARRPWQLIGVRIVGSWIAASAILVIALRLAR